MQLFRLATQSPQFEVTWTSYVHPFDAPPKSSRRVLGLFVVPKRERQVEADSPVVMRDKLISSLQRRDRRLIVAITNVGRPERRLISSVFLAPLLLLVERIPTQSLDQILGELGSLQETKQGDCGIQAAAEH